jgi:hypothetical protein
MAYHILRGCFMRKGKFRKSAFLLFAALLLCSFGANAWAASELPGGGGGEGAAAPLRASASGVLASLSFSGTTAMCSASVEGYSGTTKISASYELQRKSGSSYATVKSWTASANDYWLDWSQNHAVTKGCTYRLYVTAKVTRNGTTETAVGWAERALA